ncbi:hypothetical protein OBV_25440 [Oscillibacter valericigenes Sjm18-20]|nr:hypothetical protein OBV_25440 [Oscillibacter valericigenes Sjm18-20]
MSMIDGDPFDSGTSKYHSPTDIYDALQEMASGEEIGILSEMFADVSWENQDYYYTDNGNKLIERWEKTTDYGDKMWLMDVAAWQLDDEDANDWMYQILCNDELAKRIGFKKLFIDNVLGGMSSQYKDAAEAFEDELGDLDRNDFYANSKALETALASIGWRIMVNPYGKLCSAVYAKLKGLRLEEERQLVSDSRAMLTAYDDFMFGLKSNQYLYNQQETMYQRRVAELQAKYETVVKALLASAQAQGIVLRLPDTPLQLDTLDVSRAEVDKS